MAITPHNSKAIKDLVASGVIPPACFRFQLIAESGKAVTLRADCYVTEQQFQLIADALIADPQVAAEMVQVAVHSTGRIGFDRYDVDKDGLIA
jgi:hypothetical protein